MGIVYKGAETEFEDIPWKDLSESEYATLKTQLNPVQTRIADKARGVTVTVKMGPVTAAVKGKVIASDPYANFFKPLAPLFPEPVKKFSFEWWANQMYKECPPQDKGKFFRRVYAEDGTVKPRYKSNSPAQDQDGWAILLEDMLKSGFEEFPDNMKGVDDVLFPHISGERSLCLGFRGELRQPHQVKAHNGCKPKMQIASLRKDFNIQVWHPFSKPEHRNKVYYRKFNGDNCLYTSVSVAYDFDTASKFPLLCDLEDATGTDTFGTATVEAKGIASRVARIRAEIGGQITKQHFDPGSRAVNTKPEYNPGTLKPAPPDTRFVIAQPDAYHLRLLVCTRINVYLFRVRGTIWNTEQHQTNSGNSPFPERATDSIPWGDFLARVMIDRIHYGADSNDGHLSVIHGFEFLHRRDDLIRLLGGGVTGELAFGKLYLYLRDLVDRGKLHADGSGGMHFATANTNPAVHIRKVVKIEPRTDWGYNPAK